MDLNAFLDGFALVVEPHNLLYCLIGVLIGMIIGVLPGLGPAATIAILLPITYTIDPVSAIIMLAGIYYGAQYGGTITSVLLRLPGEASSVVTVFDGFALAKQGKAGTALGIAAIGSFIGATISIIGLTLLGPLVAEFALDFGPPEYAALALLGVLLVATIGNGNPVKAAAATSSFIPLLTIGIPANASMAMLYAALLVVGVTPGPQLIDERPDLFWGVVNSMYIGNLILLLLSIPLVGIFVRILRVRPAILAPITALITILGVYTIRNSVFDIFLMIFFGVVGYLMKKTGFEPGPMVLAFVLGSLIESSFRRSTLIFEGA